MNSIKRTTLSKTFGKVIVIALIGAFAMPALAAAQGGPTADQYEPTSEAIAGLTESGGGGDSSTPVVADQTEAVESQVGELPFTGLDVIGLFVIAIAVAGSGLLLQRAVSKE